MGNTHKQGNCACKFLCATIICFASLITFHAKALSQPGESITLKANDIALVDVFKSIYKQTKLKVTYSNIDFNDKEKVTVNFSNTPMRDVMTFLLKDKDFNFQFTENLIIISKKEKESSNVLPADTLINIIPSVTGKVTDSEGKPVPGATVIVKGTQQGSTTDAEGNFTLNDVKRNSNLLVSSIGYETREFAVKGASILVKLNIVVSGLDETVVIAYGTTTKRYSTGNISTVKAKEIEKQPVTNPLLALQGRVPGLFITQANGLPGSGVTVRIQGKNSLSMGNDPLIVIDGIPYSSQMLPTLTGILGSSGNTSPTVTGSGNPLSFINPSDIESIDILKDADATSIYGSRAAAGAILITTKKGKAGPTRIGIDMQAGWGNVARKLNVLNTQQYLEMRHEAKVNDNKPILETDYDINGTWDTTRYTDWVKELIGGVAHFTNLQGSISGGSQNTNFLVSAAYRRQTTVFPGDMYDQNGNLHINLNNTSGNKKFRMQLSGSYMVDDNRLIATDLTNDAVKLAPNAPSLYKENSTLNWGELPDGNSTWTNPLAYLNQKYRLKTSNLVSSLLLSYQILPQVNLKSTFGYSKLQTEEVNIFPRSSFAPEIRPFSTGLSSFGNGSITTWQIEPQLTYENKIGKGNISVLLGATILQTNNSRQAFDATGFNSDLVMEDIRAASSVVPSSTTASMYRYSAMFGRATYNFDNKYVLNLTARRDGSSRFGSENHFHTFGSIGAGWIFSNEALFRERLNFLSFGKLRISYGSTGNDQIGEYAYLNIYESRSRTVPYQGLTGLAPINLPNPYLQWESTRKIQIGMDLGFFNDRVLLNANYYLNRSSNQLQNYSLPIITGFQSIIQNFPATIQNYGWEVSISSTNFRNDRFIWSTNLNLTIPKNKLVEFPGLSESSVSNLLVVGEPVTIIKRYHFGGVDPSTGVFQFFDNEHKLTFDPGPGYTNRTEIINTDPKFYGGIQNTFGYKSIELDFLLQFSKQFGQNYYFGDRPGRFFGTSNIGNQPVYVLDRWTKPGDNATHQRFSSTYPSTINTPFRYATQSNAAWGDASYIRLKNISISWVFPGRWSSKARLQSLKLYMQGQNLLTITSYRGMDPETKSSTTLPPLRMLTVGVRATL